MEMETSRRRRNDKIVLEEEQGLPRMVIHRTDRYKYPGTIIYEEGGINILRSRKAKFRRFIKQ